MKNPNKSKMTNEEKFIRSYIASLLWSTHDDEGSFDRFDWEDISPSAEATFQKDCQAFLKKHASMIRQYCEIIKAYNNNEPIDLCAHDFALTRNHHGSGFWDQGLGLLGEWLTTAAEAFGEQELYVGDDGKVYVS